jgi:hypothetical protein
LASSVPPRRAARARALRDDNELQAGINGHDDGATTHFAESGEARAQHRRASAMVTRLCVDTPISASVRRDRRT